ncbi:MAG: T9SS type A sorting domain-containing protein, partial [Fimbriimonadaceae bacterium]|nr:T9SS type A sorting domain-containing protein [Chitinophagales bacterium]
VCDNLEITPEGKIILIGLAANDIGIVQYTLTGALDSSFNEDGKSIIPTAYGAKINDFKILDDGSIIACGAMEINATGNSDNAIFKFDNNGDPYLSFADSGVFKVPNDYIASDSVTFIDLHAYDKISITNESEIIVGYAVDIYGEYWAGHGVSKILLINACEIAPSGLFADNIMSNKAKLHWNADAGALKYKVQYRPTTSAAWTTVNGTTNIKAITGLAANTTYKYRVRSQCSPTLVSPWSAVSTFTTLPLKEGEIISEDELEIHIYPNPASDKINIELNETPHNMGSIHIYDIAGKLIEIKPLINQSTQLTLSLDPGIYFFELISYDGTTQTEKVIIE